MKINFASHVADVAQEPLLLYIINSIIFVLN
jgi:hypothetical protein